MKKIITNSGIYLVILPYVDFMIFDYFNIFSTLGFKTQNINRNFWMRILDATDISVLFTISLIWMFTLLWMYRLIQIGSVKHFT